MAVVTGCTTLSVRSDPPGARVLWSRDGLEPYRPWPPNSWELLDRRRSNQTPFSTTGLYGDTLFVTVDMEGYHRPLPQLVQLYPWKRERLEFELSELPSTREARMREQGFLYYRGQWVDPDEAGVVEYQGVVMPRDQAFRLGQIDKGLVEYDGEWMTAEQARQREEEKRRAEGLVAFKDRWVRPEQAELEMRIDEEVESIRETKAYPDLGAPRFVGRPNIPQAQVQIYNSSAQGVRFLFSGEQSFEFHLDPYKSIGVRSEERIVMPPGRYDVAIVPTGRDASGRDLAEILEGLPESAGIQLSRNSLWGSWPLPGGTLIAFNYTGSEEELSDTVDRFDYDMEITPIAPPELEVPDIEIPRNNRREGQQRRMPGAGPPR